jgi:putative transcriptional regulator
MLLEADPGGPEDFPVGRAALDRAHTGRRIRRLRNRLGLTQEGFAERYGIPLSAIRQYEIARTMTPPAVCAYLTVIEREPEMAARAPSRRRLRADIGVPVLASHHTLDERGDPPAELRERGLNTMSGRSHASSAQDWGRQPCRRSGCSVYFPDGNLARASILP